MMVGTIRVMSTARNAALAELFAASSVLFPSSPLYARLVGVVAADDRLLALAAEARAGQLPPNLLLAAVHYLLMLDPSPALAAWYPSLGGGGGGEGGGAADGDPGPAFTAFCLERRDAIAGLMRHRLVQANVVKRAVALRLGMAEVAALTREPVTLVEVGCSAGALLRFDAYRYDLGGRVRGDASSPVLVSADWRDGTPPDLGGLPVIADRVGVDLNPIDATDPGERRWLRALVWPENTAQARLQDAALRMVADDPPRTVAGDVADVLPRITARVPRGTPVVVFHSATRLHVPHDRRPRFDAAIADVARDHNLFHLSYEAAHEGNDGAPVFALDLSRDGGPARRLAVGDGHGEWLSGAFR